MPFTATISPAPSATAAAAAASKAGAERRVGPVRPQQPQRRAADRTRVGLGVEAAVGRVVVLGLAGRAHPEAGHRRERPVVGDPADDREARPAVGAVDERVAVAPVGGVVKLAQAVLAGRPVGRDRRVRLAAARALGDAEAGLAPRREPFPQHPLDHGQRWSVGTEPGQEPVDGAGLALDLDEHPAHVVQHVARQAELGGQTVDVGPEADALHRALDPGPGPLAGGHAHGGGPTSPQSTW